MATLSNEIARFLKLQPVKASGSFRIVSSTMMGKYRRSLIEYDDQEGATIPAFLLEPAGVGPFPAVLIHHQHNGERHLGKSEVCGLAGNPLQAFGPALAERGIVVLAPDSICFEDRRPNRKGTEPDAADADWLQHFNEMTYRLVQGDTLMRKVLHDARIASTILRNHPKVDRHRVGVLGHSYGGNTVLFQMAVETDLAFGCSSGAACTYANKIGNRTGLELALAIPGFLSKFEITDLVSSVGPRKLLLVSATEDKYSKDADVIFEKARGAVENDGVGSNLVSKRYSGGHPLTLERFDFIVDWIAGTA